MTLPLAGLLAGVAFASGLNLYLTVAALGILSRLDLLQRLPPGLQGLEGGLVIASALALFLVEAALDKVNHVDSLWDAVHTFVRPPAAALLAIAALWGEPTRIMAGGAALALLVALAAHGAKAGLRLTLNTTLHTRWQPWISTSEDLLAVALAVVALQFPEIALAAVGAALLLGAVFGPRLWRAFGLGMRSIAAWLRSIFVPAGWRDFDDMPRDVRTLVGDSPLGTAPPRGARATLHRFKGAGAFRNGWLVLADHGLVFVFRTALGSRRIDLPAPAEIRLVPGVWADLLRIGDENGAEYTIFLLKDGPEPELAVQHLNPVTT